MKHFAKLTLFFTVSFVGILLVSSLTALLEEWIQQAVLFPPGEKIPLTILPFVGNSVSAAFFISILLGVSYASRRHLDYPVVFVILLTFSLVFCSAVFVGMEKFAKLGDFSIKQPANPPHLTQPGYIYNPRIVQNGNYNTLFVFLQDPLIQGGSRVVASNDLYYQKQNSAQEPTALVPSALEPSPLPFAKEKSGVLESIKKDFLQSSLYYTALFKADFSTFCVYIGSLAIFLLALGCLINISYWHLANLFFSILVFRGALALEIFLNQASVSGQLQSFAGKAIPSAFINPLIFCFLAVLILIYSGLVYLARGRASHA